MDTTIADMMHRQIAIARDALNALPHAENSSRPRLENQIALALESIRVLMEREVLTEAV